jgi:phosphoserine phosphatase
MSILVLVANPAEPALNDALVGKVLREVGGTLNWLARSIACEIHNIKSSDAADIARQIVAGQPIDCVWVAKAGRRKKLLLADMDSTMINQECIDELAGVAGVGPQVAEITARAMKGEIEFKTALESRVALLKGITRKTIDEVRRQHITFTPGGRALVQTMKAHGAYTAMVSGGFAIFARPVAASIGFDEYQANRLEFDGDVLTGKVATPIIDHTGKLTRLEFLARTRAIALSETLAVGDGANDLPAILAAGMGVALHAAPRIAEQAPIRLDHADLTALLYLQGYSDEDFVL